MTVEKVSVSLPKVVAQAMRREAKKQGVSASRVCTTALVHHLSLECPHCGQVYNGKRKDET
jgi:hypothetical protein